MTNFLSDLRHAVRTLARSRGFTAVAVATLALGIGANTGMFTESLVLALSGAGLGILFAGAGVPVLLALAPRNIPRLENVEIDGSVLLFTAGLAVATALLFGLAPSWGILRRSARESPHTRTTAAPRGESRIRGALVAAEIALALTLLTGASLLVRSFVNLQSVGPGFQPHGVLKFELDLPKTRYPTLERIRQAVEAGIASRLPAWRDPARPDRRAAERMR